MEKIEQIVLAGGCFWCTEAVFQRVAGVISVRPGFAGGTVKNPAYREVVTGRTGHAESVEVIYNSAIVDIDSLLIIFFSTHDPTTLNRQGNDVGTHYRSAIFYTTEEQREAIGKVLRQLKEQAIFENPIVTEVLPLSAFYPAELEHHNYYNEHQSQPYCAFVIEPKIKKLQKHFSNQLKSV